MNHDKQNKSAYRASVISIIISTIALIFTIGNSIYSYHLSRRIVLKVETNVCHECNAKIYENRYNKKIKNIDFVVEVKISNMENRKCTIDNIEIYTGPSDFFNDISMMKALYDDYGKILKMPKALDAWGQVRVYAKISIPIEKKLLNQIRERYALNYICRLRSLLSRKYKFNLGHQTYYTAVYTSEGNVFKEQHNFFNCPGVTKTSEGEKVSYRIPTR